MPGAPFTQSLFTSPDYLAPLEQHGCATPATGWTPAHAAWSDGSRLIAYEKAHSWGEFVFDQAIARAYQVQGWSYYPRLVCAVPFTPVPGPRLLAADDAGRLRLAAHLQAQAIEQGASGAHVLFLPPAEAQLLAAQGWLHREQPRFVWHRDDHADFEGFLGSLAHKARKNIRRERRRIAEQGLEIRWQAAGDLAEGDWPEVHALYARTYAVRGQAPYLNLECLRAWGRNFPERMQFCLASRGGHLVAMAFFFQDGDTLYGRHWGAAADWNSLHFELCYYQGIERCLDHGLAHFDAGVQGEHKLQRGFVAERSHSVHWFAHPALRPAIADFFARERTALDAAYPPLQ